MNYGQEIFKQVQLFRSKVWSWGAQAFKTFGPEYFKDVPHRGGLLFKVNGHHHKGHVMVRLKGNDTYHICFGYLRKGSFVLRKDFPVYDGAYCDNFVDLIDEAVERIDSYAR